MPHWCLRCRAHSLVMGMNCQVGLRPSCDPSAYFDGAIDDLAFFSGALTDAEVKERWDQPLTSRVQGGLEPKLVLFYDFDTPSSANIPNLGTAGGDYDLVWERTLEPPGEGGGGQPPHTTLTRVHLPLQIRGHVANKISGVQSTEYYDTILKLAQTFRIPQFIPAWALPRSSSDFNTPVVTSAAAGATISIAVPALLSPESFTTPSSPWTTTSVYTASNGRAVHIVPRAKPVGPTAAHLTSFSGLEDSPFLLQVAGMSEMGLCMQAVITTLPSKGKLFAVATGCKSLPQPKSSGTRT